MYTKNGLHRETRVLTLFVNVQIKLTSYLLDIYFIKDKKKERQEKKRKKRKEGPKKNHLLDCKSSCRHFNIHNLNRWMTNMYF